MRNKVFFYKYASWFLLLTVMLIYGGVFSYYSIQRHNAFASGYDLANADQTIWNTAHGHVFQLSSKGKLLSRMTIHADIVLLFIAPLYTLWDNVRLLLILQSVAVATGAIPVYLLAQRVLRHTAGAFLCVAIYLLNPGMQWANMYDFHGVVLAIPFLLFTFYFAYIGRWRWFIVFALLAAFTKEEVSLLIVMIGIYLMVWRRERRVGIITILAGMTWFLGIVFWVMPYFRGGSQHWAFAWYQFAQPEGETETQKTFLFWEVFNRLFLASDVMPYYFTLLKPFAFILPVLGLPVLILAAPELLVNTLSTHAEMRGTMLHY